VCFLDRSTGLPTPCILLGGRPAAPSWWPTDAIAIGASQEERATAGRTIDGARRFSRWMGKAPKNGRVGRAEGARHPARGPWVARRFLAFCHLGRAADCRKTGRRWLVGSASRTAVDLARGLPATGGGGAATFSRCAAGSAWRAPGGLICLESAAGSSNWRQVRSERTDYRRYRLPAGAAAETVAHRTGWEGDRAQKDNERQFAGMMVELGSPPSRSGDRPAAAEATRRADPDRVHPHRNQQRPFVCT